MDSVEDLAECESTTALVKARDVVRKLLNFRDEYLLEAAEKYALLSEDSTGDSECCTLYSAETVAHAITELDQLISQKPRAMQHLLEDTLETLQDMEHIFARASSHDKAEFCYLNGKVLNTIHPETYEVREGDAEANDISSQAAQWLTRALKFNPQFTEAWCELGESCWRQGDPLEAANHFRQALKIDPENVEALCQLSMVLRQLPPTAPNTSSSAEEISASKSQAESTGSLTGTSILSESLRLAHTAVRHQPSNGHAWSVLGNALLTTFFQSWGSVAPPPGVCLSSSSGHNTTTPSADTTHTPTENDGEQRPGAMTSSQLIMTRCIAAYAQAAKDKTVALEPNFHYNRGVAWHFQDSFTNALCSWLRAICLDPQWQAPRVCATRLIGFLKELNMTLEQVRAELSESTLGQCQRQLGSDTTVSNGKQQTRLRRDSHPMRVTNFIAPLGPYLTLVESVPSTCPVDTVQGKGKNSTTSRVIPSTASASALTKLLGPYCPSSAGLGSQNLAMKGKRGRATGKRATTFHNSPFNNVSNWKFSLFNDLKVGQNKDRVCVGRVLKGLPSDTELALNLLLLDARGTALAVRLYNIGKGLGPVRKDIIAIPHPFIEERDIPYNLIGAILVATGEKDSSTDPCSIASQLDHKLSELSLQSGDMEENNDQEQDSQRIDKKSNQLKPSVMRIRILRVPLPDVLVVNGQPVGSSWTAAPVLRNIFFTAV